MIHRRRLTIAALALAPAGSLRAGSVASEDSLRLLLPFPAIGSPEFIGALPASRAQRGLQAAAPLGPADPLARIVARAAEMATGRPVRVARLPGARGARACAAAAADPATALLASEALCVHDAIASAPLQRAVDRLAVQFAAGIVPYRRVSGAPGAPIGGCTIAHAGHGGRAASLAGGLVARDPGCREVAFNGGQAALRAVAVGQAGQAVLPWALAREALAGGQLVDLGEVRPAGWFAVLAAPAGPWAEAADAVARALVELAPPALLDRLGLEPDARPAAAVRALMLQERQAARLSRPGASG